MKVLNIAMFFMSVSLFAQNNLDKLIQRREEIKQWSVKCDDGSYSEILNECKQHDIVLFSGISCLAATLAEDGETQKMRCDDVKEAQGANGRWWRGETRVDDGIENAFSRDMARGVHAYLIAKAYLNKDLKEKKEVADSARKWLKWISMPEADNKLCTDFTKNRCRITLGSRNLFLNVFKAIDAFPKKAEKMSAKRIVKKIERSHWYLKKLFLLETKVSEKGYPRHLKATSTLIYRIINNKKDKKITKVLNKTARWLHKKDRENNLLKFLDEGISEKLIENVLSLCPKELIIPEGQKRDFQWQRTGMSASENADGHDCIYLLNLMIAKIKGNLTW